MRKLGFKFRQKYFDVGIIFGFCGHYDKKVYVTYANFKKEQFFYPAFVIAEEIFHLWYWYFFERIFKIKVKDPYEINFKKEKFNIWHISELLPEYYLKSPVFQKFNWDEFDRIKGYPWIREMKKISDPIFMRQNNFRDFIILLHKECGCFSRKNLRSKTNK